MNKVLTILASGLFLFAGAAEIYVSPTGSDSAVGTQDAPLHTIQAAVARLQSGDTCFVRGGTYHEAVEITVSGVCLKAYPGEAVVFDGTENVTGAWSRHKGCIYKTRLPKGVEQIFVGREMMMEARWPNMSFHQRFDRSCWAKVDQGSTHGKIISQAIAQSGIDWTGAMACLNVAHQWWTWNRPVVRHQAGSNTLEYPADLVGLCNYDPAFPEKTQEWKDAKWADDYFYLFGKLEALDVETEWHQDPEDGMLYFYAPGGVDPAGLDVKYKVRDYAIYAQGQNHLTIHGIDFFGSTFRLDDCNDCVIEDCELLYPTWSRTITEYDQSRQESVITKIVGDNNTVRHCSLAYANNMGLMTMGNSNLVENCIIHDVNWYGTLIYPALQLSASPHLGVNWFDTIQYPPTERTIQNSDVTSYGNVARSNTLYNSGSSLLVYHAAESLVEYNHIYDGGLACKDISLIYGCWPFSHDSVVRYNWVHGCVTDGYSGRGRDGGIGIRADDQSRRNIFHHNVVWDCGKIGIVMKGEDHQAYNNTIFRIGPPNDPQLDLMLPQEAEPIKIWAVQWPQLLRQNQWTEVISNLCRNITISHKVDDALEVSDRVEKNLRGQDVVPLLQDPEHFNFRPIGAAKSFGAYDSEEEYWVPGAYWDESFTVLKAN